ncbi:MAG: electron transfer flavoprotein subunit beta/FixA family protein [Bacteroidota bacterium]|nr:electron transfer flavoprotein subunit beta/FixA family protein [Bacteroidota bacterium]MDE2833927.1 electron transfer flavoprotein subunit beta/FixA family protein [Bacteroidota bacterium]MDE2958254.1 electron transfer flavoprotein subunit beta/FixA family protein [Bacteroidota bacterium]
MKIAVCIKQTADTETVPGLDADGTRVLTDDITWIINPHDESALEVALRQVEEYGGSVTVLALGPQRVQKALREGLAMGADRAIHLRCERMPNDARVTARALKPILESEGFDLVLAGQVSVDNGGGQLPQRLGVLLGWPSVSAVEGLEVDGRKLTAQRPVEGGREQHELNLPAVIGINRRIGEPRYPSFRNIMKAKRKPVIAIEVTLEPSQLVCEQLRLPPQKTAGQIMTYGPGVADRVAHLIRSEAGIVW